MMMMCWGAATSFLSRVRHNCVRTVAKEGCGELEEKGEGKKNKRYKGVNGAAMFTCHALLWCHVCIGHWGPCSRYHASRRDFDTATPCIHQ